jgi:hypothetical protein
VAAPILRGNGAAAHLCKIHHVYANKTSALWKISAPHPLAVAKVNSTIE